MMQAQAQAADREAIRAVLDRQTAAWAAGDAAAFGADTLPGLVFTNVVGMFVVGREGFDAQHARIFATIYKGSTMTQAVAALTFVRPDVAIVDTLATLKGFAHLPPGVAATDGELHTRLEQVMVREPDGWKVAAFHNVAVNPAAAGPPPPAT